MGGTLCIGAEEDCEDGEPSDLNLIAAVTVSYEAATAPSLTNATDGTAPETMMVADVENRGRQLMTATSSRRRAAPDPCTDMVRDPANCNAYKGGQRCKWTYPSQNSAAKVGARLTWCECASLMRFSGWWRMYAIANQCTNQGTDQSSYQGTDQSSYQGTNQSSYCTNQSSY